MDLYNPKISYKLRYVNESAIAAYRGRVAFSILLDCSLITPYNYKFYNLKIIDCKNYYQIYKISNPIKIKNKNLEINLFDKDKSYLDKLLLNPKKKRKEPVYKVIESKNINRSKNEMIRIVKCNEEKFKTFITLTFANNVCDIKEANKKFDWWRTNIKKKYKDFAYVAVPEFQKRGAVHYHLLTNLDIKQNPDIIILQEGERCKYDVKYWRHGFSSVKKIKNINIVGYMSKYMTKDIDNRLWGQRRYYYSQNLYKPVVSYINTNNLNDFRMYVNHFNKKTELIYSSEYENYFGDNVQFSEFKIT